MPSFNRGDTLNLTLDFNDVITFTGKGTVSYTPSGGSTYNTYLNGTNLTFGPLKNTSTTVVISCDTAGSYTISNDLSIYTGIGDVVQKRQNIATRAWAVGAGASLAFNAVNPSTTISTTGQFMTCCATMEVATDFDAVRVLFVSVNAADQLINSATAVVSGDASTAAAQLNQTGFAAPSSFLFNGAAGATLKAGTATNPSILLTDWLNISSTPRTDGGTLPLIFVRAAFTSGASGATTPITFWNRTGADWNSGTGKFWGAISTATTDQTTGNTTGATMAATGNSPIFGVQYRSRRGVISTLWLGDSITSGANLTNGVNRSFAVKSCQAISTTTNPYEFCIAGFSGQTIQTWRTWLETAYSGATGGTTGIPSGATNLQALSPSHLCINAWSVNNATTSTITAAQINTIRQNVAQLAYDATQLKIVPVYWDGIPRATDGTGVTSFYSAATDPLRTAFNNDMLTCGYPSVNISSTVGDSNVPQGFQSGMTTDGVHLSNTGDTAAVSPMSALLSILY